MTLRATGEGEGQLLSNLVEWLLHYKVKNDDALLTRYRNGRSKTVIRKDVASAIKDWCASRGLDPARFSTK